MPVFGSKTDGELPEGQEEEYTYGEVGEDSEEIVVDFSKVGLVPPAGSYMVEITSAQTKNAKSSGNPMLSLVLTIREPEEYDGVVVFDNLMLKGAGMNRTKAAFEHVLGSAQERVALSSFRGQTFWVTLEPESDPQYGDRARVAYYGTR